jgi:hypothetical protein
MKKITSDFKQLLKSNLAQTELVRRMRKIGFQNLDGLQRKLIIPPLQSRMIV